MSIFQIISIFISDIYSVFAFSGYNEVYSNTGPMCFE